MIFKKLCDRFFRKNRMRTTWILRSKLSVTIWTEAIMYLNDFEFGHFQFSEIFDELDYFQYILVRFLFVILNCIFKNSVVANID